VADNSPLRNIYSLFWSTSVNDEGVPQQNRFHALVNGGKIEVVAPARVQGFRPDGNVLLTDGGTVKADLVLLATGYSSSWTGIFDGMKVCLVSFIESRRLQRIPQSG
jgi:lysine/ornithine N-monooxygenase